MRYFANYENGLLVAIGTGDGGTEITAESYNVLMHEIREKADLVDRCFSGEITINEVPPLYRDEVQERISARHAANADIDATDEDFLAALTELGVTVDEET